MMPKIMARHQSGKPIIAAEVEAVAAAVRSRYRNAGQHCIAAKRCIVDEAIVEAFQARFVEAVQGRCMGSR